MKREDLKRSLESIEPGKADVDRMLGKILAFREAESQGTHQNMKSMSYMKSGFGKFTFRKAVPVFAAALVIAVSILVYNFGTNPWNSAAPENSNRFVSSDDIANSVTDMQEDARDIANISQNQFKIGNRHYIILNEGEKSGFNLPGKIAREDIGDKIATITDSADKSLKGLDVYYYRPAGCEAVVALKKGEEYVLFRFYTFDSYINNQDEDAAEYLRLYGIENPDDISRIQFIGHSERAKLENRMDIISEITDREKIREFHGYFSALKNSSDRYFEAIGRHNVYDEGGRVPVPAPDPKEAPDYMAPDYSAAGGREPVYGGGNSASGYEGGVEVDLPVLTPADADYDYAKDGVISPDSPVSRRPADWGNTGSVMPVDGGNYGKVAPTDGATTEARTSEGSSGAGMNPLGDMVTIRIYNSKGIYFEMPFYPNIGFISRYEVKGAFLDLLKSYCK